MERNKPLGINSPGASSKKRVKKKSKRASQEEFLPLSLLNLPPELFEEIMSYLSFEEAMIIRQLDHDFYERTTGYKQVGVFGVDKENEPDWRITNASWSFKHAVDFDKLTCKHGPIPSFLFYQLIREVKNLPSTCWPYLQETQICKIDLWHNRIGPEAVKILGKCLQQSKICQVYLWYNQIGDVGAENFGKALAENVSIRDVNLSSNNLSAAGAERFTKHLTKNIHKISLWDNKIKDDGALAVVKNIRDKNVEEINLGKNEIGNQGVISVLKNLVGTSIRRLYLRNNEITDEGVIEATKYILKTNLGELNLACNKITDQGIIEIAKGCCGSKIKVRGHGSAPLKIN